MTKKKKDNLLVERAKKVVSDWGEDAADFWMPFPIFKPLRKIYRIILDRPRVLTREELYLFGLKMLRRGKKNIVAVNTVGREDSPNFFIMPGRQREKRYYEQLFRIVQKNRHRLGTPLPVRRYMDLADVNKCEEAISLLLYGGEIEISDSNIQLEFLIRDDEEVLLGFEEGRELSHGIELTNRVLAAALDEWINSQVKHTSPPAGAPEPEASAEPAPARFGQGDLQEMVGYIRKLREGKKPVEPKSLINAAELLRRMEIDDLFKAAGKAFDDFKHWYPNLYDQSKSGDCYKALAKSVIHELFRSKRPTFLDCGCAHGLGAKALSDMNVEYWGVDASPELIEIAKGRWGSGNFIAGDIGNVLLDKETRAEGGRRLPRKFDVIACQGNTFDFFLGEPQKWFMLTLFRRRLNKNGILFLTQKSFTRDEQRVERWLPLADPNPASPGPPPAISVVYIPEWEGDFVKLNVVVGGQQVGSVIQHPTDPVWLQTVCEGLGFERLDGMERLLPEWYRPHGAKHPPDVYIFQLKSESE